MHFPNSFKNRAEAYRFPFKTSRKHRSAAHHNRRQVEPHCCHNHPWNNLVTTWNEHQGIQLMPFSHHFNRIRDEFTTGQGKVHPIMPHRQPIANGHSRKLKRSTTIFPNPYFDGLSNLAQMHVPRDKFCKRVDNPNKRLGNFPIRKP